MMQKSVKKRAARREPFDYYPTPKWCVDRLLETGVLPANKTIWLEPSAGDGSIIRAVNSHMSIQSGQIYKANCSWFAVEIQPKFEQTLSAEIGQERVIIDNFLDLNPAEHFGVIPDVVIGNPPYNEALSFVKRSMDMEAKQIAFLLRLGFLASNERHSFLTENTPDIYVLPNRPSFAKGKTDTSEYAWFVWTHQGTINGYKNSAGKVRVLNTTSKDLRVKAKIKQV